MALYEVISAAREEVMLRWHDLVRGNLAPEAMPEPELIDHLPEFLDETLEALSDGAGQPDPAAASAHPTTAAGHGAQRLRLGFSIDAVVREYGFLRQAIFATAQEAEVPVTVHELEIVCDYMINGIADAVAEYARRRDAELLRQANEHFAFIAHELRNPLSAATLALRQLEASGRLPAGERSVGVLTRGLQRTAELIEHSLQTARVASGIELRRQWTTLRPLLEDAELGAISEAEAKGVRLHVVCDRDERVNVDLRLVRSAVTNLLLNGVKYTPPGGEVELRGRIANGQLVIEVEDRCGGLDPAKVSAAFAPFVRLDGHGNGFGLGLAIAKQAVDAHGGSIRVQNLPGTGCIFVLELPRDAPG